MPTIDEYFEKNGVVPKTVFDMTREQRVVSRLPTECGEEFYFEEYFKTDFDVLIDSVDIRANKVLFDLVLAEARKFSDLFEPCCQSGIFGCYIALETGAAFKGMDLSRLAIEKARKRAELNRLPAEIFVEGDVLGYAGQHEAVVGRYVVNGQHHDINEDMLAKVREISSNIVLVQPAQANLGMMGPRMYQRAFERLGFSFEVLGSSQRSATGAMYFVVKASKNST